MAVLTSVEKYSAAVATYWHACAISLLSPRVHFRLRSRTGMRATSSAVNLVDRRTAMVSFIFCSIVHIARAPIPPMDAFYGASCASKSVDNVWNCMEHTKSANCLRSNFGWILAKTNDTISAFESVTARTLCTDDEDKPPNLNKTSSSPAVKLFLNAALA